MNYQRRLPFEWAGVAVAQLIGLPTQSEKLPHTCLAITLLWLYPYNRLI